MVCILGFWLGHISYRVIRKSIPKGLALAPLSTIGLTRFGAKTVYIRLEKGSSNHKSYYETI